MENILWVFWLDCIINKQAAFLLVISWCDYTIPEPPSYTKQKKILILVVKNWEPPLLTFFKWLLSCRFFNSLVFILLYSCYFKFLTTFLFKKIKFHPGKNVGLGKDYTIFSLIDGLVKFEKYGPDRKKVG